MGTIMVVADDDETCIAIPRGLELASKVEHDVEVVAFTYTPLRALNASSTKQAAVRKKLLADREKTLKEQINKFKRPGQKVTHQVVWSRDIDTWVTRQCKGGSYVGVVKTGGEAGTMVQSSTNWQLLRKCQAPLLLVAEKRWHRAKPVMVSLDLMTRLKAKKELNRKLLVIAMALAESLDVDLEIITAIEIPTLLADLDLVDPIAYVKEAREAMEPEIRKLAEEFELPESAFCTKRGPVEKVITSRAAKVRAQIVVMGTVGRTGVKGRLLGSTAERVLKHLKTDVLAIKP